MTLFTLEILKDFNIAIVGRITSTAIKTTILLNH